MKAALVFTDELVPLAYVEALLELAGELGLSRNTLFAASGVRPQALENPSGRLSFSDFKLLAGVALQRPAWIPLLEVTGLALSGLLLIGIMPVLRPRFATASFAGLAALWIISGYTIFYFTGWLFDASTIVLLLMPVFIALLSATWII